MIISSEIASICRDLRSHVETMPPGRSRERMEGHLGDLRDSLTSLPARVGAKVEMKSVAEIEVLLAEEFDATFGDVFDELGISHGRCSN